MSNYSYLCATNLETTYPSFVQAGYEPERQTIACDVWCVPLLWLGLFRARDIVSKTITDSGGDEFYTEAPLVSRLTAIRQLSEALPYFNRLFAEEGPLEGYGALLQAALKPLDFSFVTIELQEIACLSVSEQAFYSKFRSALEGIGADFSQEAKHRLVEVSGFKELVKFPAARLLIDDLEATDDDYWNHCRVCGASYLKEVPWEPPSDTVDG